MSKLNPRAKVQHESVSMARDWPDNDNYLLSKNDILGKLRKTIHSPREGRESETIDWGEVGMVDRIQDENMDNLFARDVVTNGPFLGRSHWVYIQRENF